MSLDIIDALSKFRIHHRSDQQLKLRIGVHSGSVMTGVIGTKFPRYRVFGENVKIALAIQDAGEGKMF